MTIALELPDHVLDAIADRVLERLADLDTTADPGGYLDVAAAAEFLSCPTSRIYSLTSAGRLPVHRDGSRLLFDRGELREYVRNGGAKRP